MILSEKSATFRDHALVVRDQHVPPDRPILPYFRPALQYARSLAEAGEQGAISIAHCAADMAAMTGWQ
jgi:hypothetical protein